MFTLRAATVADSEQLVRAVADGLEGYRSFAPDGWAPPAVDHHPAQVADADVICLLAEDAAGLAGQVTVLPAARTRLPVQDPALAHMSYLFVRTDVWGTGLARTLHEAALDAARERAFSTMRLFCAADQARARRFYEREGWELAGEPWREEAVGLDMVEYRRRL